MRSDYRKEIDGLRAIAILPVIFFHAGIDLFSGGFIGVDVFFVISGYLITKIILVDLENEDFSIKEFYRKRARRILPMLFFIVFICILFSWAIFLQRDFDNFLRSVISASFFVSNIMFFRDSGYFDTSSELKPLLHTWSLSLEEQFYLFFPFLIVIVWRKFRNHIFLILSALLLISLVVAQARVIQNPVEAFYMFHTRAWELLSGAIAALILKESLNKRVSTINSSIISIIGIFLITIPIFLYNKQTIFPGLTAIPPVLGTMLVIIFASNGNIAARILGNRFFVSIGLLSYSAYLWHHPLFAFARYISGGEVSINFIIGLIVLTFALSYFSFKFIETPFRRSWDSKVLTKSILLLLSISTTCFLILKLDLPSYRGIEEKALAEKLNFSSKKSVKCDDFEFAEGSASCLTYGGDESAKKIVIWGDSHALSLTEFVPNVANVNFIFIYHPGCPPIINVKRLDALGNSVNCNNFDILRKYADFINSQNPDLVLLVGRWSLYIEGWMIKRNLQVPNHYIQGGSFMEEEIINSKDVRNQILKDGFVRTIDYLKADRKLILNQVMDFSDIGHIEMNSRDSFEIDLLSYYNSSRFEVINSLKGVEIIDASDFLCEENKCYTKKLGIQLYYDDNHLNKYGAYFVWDGLLPELLINK